jgi:hypothetical protein
VPRLLTRLALCPSSLVPSVCVHPSCLVLSAPIPCSLPSSSLCTGVTLDAKRLERVWDSSLRGKYYEDDEALRNANKAASAAGGLRSG